MSYDVDVAVVGSGFGGSVTALRLAEKGWRVTVLEQGNRVGPREIEAGHNRLRDFLWLPTAGWTRGYFTQRLFRHLGVIGGVGVGGGSLVYGAVLLEASPSSLRKPGWRSTGVDWARELAPGYRDASAMLGQTTSAPLTRQDRLLEAAAAELGAGNSFGPVRLGIDLGEPAAVGCRRCGACLAGCPYGAKHSLDRTYLARAEQLGVTVRTRHRVERIVPLPRAGYALESRSPDGRHRNPPLRARRVVLSAGVLGTLELLFRNRDEHGTLPGLSRRLGDRVRTNSEALVAILDEDPEADLTEGPAISSHFFPDAGTHVTQNRLPAIYSRLMRAQMLPMADGPQPGRRFRVLAAVARHPVRTLRALFARNWHRRITALTVMQHTDNELAFGWHRRWWAPWSRGLRSRVHPNQCRPPSYLPVANAAARAYAHAGGGQPLNLATESIGELSLTAHILGGAVLASDDRNGVVDTEHEVFGHPGLYVIDGSVVPENIGVNPSLTIAALAERFAGRFPRPPGADTETH